MFDVDVFEDHNKRTFTARTDDTWRDFKDQVIARLDSVNIHLVFRLSVDRRAWSELGCEADFTAALTRLRERVLVARTRAVSMEIKNQVSDEPSVTSVMLTFFFLLQLKTLKVRGARGKEDKKRTWEDDIPPAVPSDMVHEVGHLRALQDHLTCAFHSKPGMKAYCWVEVAEEGIQGGHREISHSEMTLWAKYIVRQINECNGPKLTTSADTWPGDKGLPTQHKTTRLSTSEKTEDNAPGTVSASGVGLRSRPLAPRASHRLCRVQQRSRPSASGSHGTHIKGPQNHPGKGVRMRQGWEGAVGI